MSSLTYRYHAFISYTTEADYELARDLEGFLGRFHELPTPETLPLKQLRIWRDETGRSIESEGFRNSTKAMLDEYLAQCQHLVILWSVHSRDSIWMRQEFNWFLANRDIGEIRLAITDSLDPIATRDTLYWPEMLESGLVDRPWYDFRGFRKEEMAKAVKLRDYEEACIQLASDLNGYSPSELQPIWWRIKAREQQERAEREEQERQRLEIAECNARLETAGGWYERAFVFVEQRRYRHASMCLLNALTVAPPERVPDHYVTSRENLGWSEGSWAFLRYCLALAPRLVKSFGQGEKSLTKTLFSQSSMDSFSSPMLCWIDTGRLIAVAKRNEVKNSDSDPLERLKISLEPDMSVADAIGIFDYMNGIYQGEIAPLDEAGRITAWVGSRYSHRVAYGTENGWLCIWSAVTGQTIYYREEQVPIIAMAFSNDGERIATSNASGEVRVWNQLNDETPEFDIVAPASVNEDSERPGVFRSGLGERVNFYIAFVQSDKNLLFLRDSQTLLISIESKDQTVVPWGGALTKTYAHDREGRRIAYADGDIVHVRSLSPDDTTDPLLYAGQHKDFIAHIAFSANDYCLLTRGSMGHIVAWLGQGVSLERNMSMNEVRMSQTFGQSNRGVLLKHLEGIGRVSSFDPHPLKFDRVLISRGTAIEEWDLGIAFEPIAGWHNPGQGSRCAAWLPDGRRVIAGTDDGLIQLFDLDKPEEAREFIKYDAPVGDLAVSWDGKSIGSVTEDGLVTLISAGDGTVMTQGQIRLAPFAITFIGKEHKLAIGNMDGTIHLWDPSSGESPRRLGTVGEPVFGLATTPDAAILIASSASEIAAWDLQLELELWSSLDLTDIDFGIPNGRISVSQNGQLLAYGDIDGTVRCFEVDTGTMVSATNVPPSVPMKPPQVTAVTIADDNRTAFVGLWDGTLCIIDLIEGRELFRFSAHSKVITSIAQSPNSGDVLTSSLDPDPRNNQVIRVWSLLDFNLAPDPPPSDVEWINNSITAFLERHGDIDDSENDAFKLQLQTVNQPIPSDVESASQSELFNLRKALLLDPESPQRYLDLAMAFLKKQDEAFFDDTHYLEKARSYLERARSLGGEKLIIDPASQYLVAEDLLRKGEFETAIPWLERAGEGGNAEALLQLGLLALSDREVSLTEAQGVQFLGRSADLGNPIAAYNLGVYYEFVVRGSLGKTNWRQLAFGTRGTKLPDSIVQALKWYQRAADAGFAEAQVRIGDIFYEGQFLDRDIQTAQMWYEQAANQGYELAERKLSDLLKK